MLIGRVIQGKPLHKKITNWPNLELRAYSCMESYVFFTFPGKPLKSENLHFVHLQIAPPTKFLSGPLAWSVDNSAAYNRETLRFILVDNCSDGFNQLRNSD